ncbi:hypothetical protein BJP40_26940 [Streptomyces sp. CC53]|uniref:hypothetical protein n=1 Tax=Streptomyces sp. CC53 TaxID=1906740 RepID=UPI0008DD89EF|nr:hypothetical protein [Streptomyces sp. CC53]OII62876.1 hypothetical protein BJP40_26940 [Streptomyces sp. CC53]
MVYPSISPGQRLTADLLTSMLPLAAVKTAATDRASITSTSPDPDLQLSLEASAVYLLRGLIIVSGPVAADLRCLVAGPAGSSGTWGMVAPGVASTTDPDQVRTRAFSLGSVSAYGLSTTSAYAWPLWAYISTVSAGTASFDWSQQTSSATAVSVAAGSHLLAHRIA